MVVQSPVEPRTLALPAALSHRRGLIATDAWSSFWSRTRRTSVATPHLFCQTARLLVHASWRHYPLPRDLAFLSRLLRRSSVSVSVSRLDTASPGCWWPWPRRGHKSLASGKGAYIRHPSLSIPFPTSPPAPVLLSHDKSFFPTLQGSLHDNRSPQSAVRSRDSPRRPLQSLLCPASHRPGCRRFTLTCTPLAPPVVHTTACSNDSVEKQPRHHHLTST